MWGSRCGQCGAPPLNNDKIFAMYENKDHTNIQVSSHIKARDFGYFSSLTK